MGSQIQLALLAFLMIVVNGNNFALADDDVSVPQAPSDVKPLLIGAQVPDIVLRTIDDADFSLREKTTNKASVIIFYRGGW